VIRKLTVPCTRYVDRVEFNYEYVLIRDRSRDSVVGIASSYGLDGRGVGVRVPVGSRIFSSPNRPDRL
jgi:hypothetical protein